MLSRDISYIVLIARNGIQWSVFPPQLLESDMW